MKLSIEDILFLREVNGLGFQRLRKLIETGLSIEEIKSWKKSDWADIKGISPEASYSDFIKKYNDSSLHQRISTSIKNADIVIHFWEKEYPVNLKNALSPPPALFIKGDPGLLRNRLFAIIGTRTPTDYGKYYTHNFSKDLIKNNFNILSGFARGVDTIAHRTAVSEKSPTIAVLGSGLNVIYPSENRKLFDEVIHYQGAIISEFLHDTKPDAVNFPKRNRIISSLAHSILVIEAGQKSGAIITAEMAIKEKKKVFSLPGNIDSKLSIGTNQLIRNGAILTRSIHDIRETLELDHEMITKQISFLDFTKNEEKILNCLNNEPLYIDNLADKLNLAPYEILADLLNLEIKQCIRKLEGNYFIKIL